MAVGRGALEFRLRPLAKALAELLRLGLDQGGIEQLGEMLAERMDFGPRGLGLTSRLGFLGAGMGRIWGESGPGEGRARS